MVTVQCIGFAFVNGQYCPLNSDALKWKLPKIVNPYEYAKETLIAVGIEHFLIRLIIEEEEEE